MHLEAFAATAPTAASADTQADYVRGAELLREALAEGRRLISGLRPPILDERGVVAALEYLVSEVRPDIPQIEFHKPHAISAVWRPPSKSPSFASPRKRSPMSVCIASAERALVELRSTANGSRLLIRDWGRGFDPATVQEERFGLQGVRQRAALLGASAVVESAPGQGTVVSRSTFL